MFTARALPLLFSLAAAGDETWSPGAPRDELRPEFHVDRFGARDGNEALTIAMDQRPGLHGYWQRAYPVLGGQHYRFHVWRRTTAVAEPRRQAPVRVLWQDDEGRPVPHAQPVVERYLRNWGQGNAEPEHPRDGQTDADGWTEVSGVYQAPPQAERVVLELGLLWAPGGSVAWSEILWASVDPPQPRRVRLAAAHLQPNSGQSPEANLRLYEPLLAAAARQRADLVVLGECVTSVGLPGGPADAAEPIPGPSTAYLGEQARRHDLYIVAGLTERAGHLVYNTAVLIGPDGELVGQYRKVCLPRDEVARGVMAGHEYPVFETRLGRVGMMVCYDGFFPEVARGLTANGAEVIAWPVWGCNPELAAARAAENGVYLVSSTYEPQSSNWMKTAVWDPTGAALAEAQEWGDLALAEVDLARPTYWRCLGNFADQVPRHRP